MYHDFLNELINKNNISYSMLNYINDTNFEKELVEFTLPSIEYILHNQYIDEVHLKKIIILLTYIALVYYDGAFWPHVRKILQDKVDDFVLLESRIRDLVLGRLVDLFGCERRHSQIPVMYSILPFKYASNYFEFVHDIYTKNLDCHLTNFDLYEEIENVFGSIKNKLSESDDSFNYTYDGEGNVKTYKLLKSTKNIIRTGNKKSELVFFTVDILKKIDSYYNGKTINDNYYFDEAFNQWLESHPLIDVQKRKRGNQNLKSKFPYYSLTKNNYSIFLHTPVRRLFGDYDIDKFTVKIFECDQVIFESKSLVINSLLGGYEIEGLTFQIKKPLNKIRCAIFYDEKEVYNSKEYLYRDYMVFNENVEITDTNRDYNGKAFFIYKEKCDDNISQLIELSNYKVGYTYVNPSETYHIDEKYVNFSSNPKNEIIGTYNKDFEIIDDNNIMKIYSDIDSISFVVNDNDLSAYKIRINNVIINDESKYLGIVKKDYLSFVYYWDNSNKSGMYNIELINMKKNRIVNRYKFLFDPLIITKEELVSEYYLNFNYQGIYNLIDKKNKIHNNIELNLNYLNGDKFYLMVNNEKYRINFICNVPYYFIDDENYSSIYYPLQIERLNTDSYLFFVVPNCDNIVYQIGNCIKPLRIRVKNEKQCIDAGQLKSIMSVKEIDIIFRNGEIELQRLKVYYDAVYDKNKSYYVIDPKNGKIEFKTFVNGVKKGNDVYLKITKGYEVLYDEKVNLVENTNIVDIRYSVCNLKYQIYHYKTIISSFKRKKTYEILYEDTIDYYSYKGILRKFIPIKKIIFEKDEKEIVRYPLDLYIRPSRELNDYAFMGYVYKSKNNKMESFSKIDELKIVLSDLYKNGNERFMDAKVYIYYPADDENDPQIDYLQYDNKNYTILNGANRESPIITKYVLDLTNGGIEYEKSKSYSQSKVYRR